MAPAVGSFCFLLDAVGAASMRPEHFRTYVWSLRLPVQVLFFIICFFYAATRALGGGGMAKRERSVNAQEHSFEPMMHGSKLEQVKRSGAYTGCSSHQYLGNGEA